MSWTPNKATTSGVIYVPAASSLWILLISALTSAVCSSLPRRLTSVRPAVRAMSRTRLSLPYIFLNLAIAAGSLAAL